MLMKANPVQVDRAEFSPFEPGSSLDRGPNCYAWAVGDVRGHLPPGWLGARRGHPDATDVGKDPEEQLLRFMADGLLPLYPESLPELPATSWVVSVHQHHEGDFHFRKLDRLGWTEKPGDFEVRRFRPWTWQQLLRAKAPRQHRYDFGGFFEVPEDILVGT